MTGKCIATEPVPDTSKHTKSAGACRSPKLSKVCCHPQTLPWSDCGLRMHQTPDSAGRQVEQRHASITSNPCSLGLPSRWLSVRPFSTWDGSAPAPRDCRKFVTSVCKERAPGSGQPDALHFSIPPAPKTLVDRIVLAVDGQQRLAPAGGLGGDQFSGCHQAFLVGQPHRLTCLDASIKWLPARPLPRSR